MNQEIGRPPFFEEHLTCELETQKSKAAETSWFVSSAIDV